MLSFWSVKLCKSFGPETKTTTAVLTENPSSAIGNMLHLCDDRPSAMESLFHWSSHTGDLAKVLLWPSCQATSVLGTVLVLADLESVYIVSG